MPSQIVKAFCPQKAINLWHIRQLSGRRESNPGNMTPSHVYYRYTTARF